MKRFVSDTMDSLRRLNRDENGAEAGLERILLVAFIALPLLGLLIYYRGQVVQFIKDSFGTNTEGGKGPTDLTKGG
jgi:Flp pilus assembly pilin Flp